MGMYFGVSQFNSYEQGVGAGSRDCKRSEREGGIN